MKLLSHVRLFVTPWTVAYKVPPSMEFSRQEYWSGLPYPSQGIFPTQGSNLGLLHCKQVLLPSEPPGKPGRTLKCYLFHSLCIFLLIFGRTPKILVDLLMNHMESELYFLRSTKGKQLIIRKFFSFLNV